MRLSWRLGRAVRGLVRDRPVRGVSGRVAASGVENAASSWRVGLSMVHGGRSWVAGSGLLYVAEHGPGEAESLRGGSSCVGVIL